MIGTLTINIIKRILAEYNLVPKLSVVLKV